VVGNAQRVSFLVPCVPPVSKSWTGLYTIKVRPYGIPRRSMPVIVKPHTRKAVRKRIKVSAGGKVFVRRAGGQHMLRKKRSNKKRLLGKTRQLSVPQARRLMKMVFLKGRRYRLARRVSKMFSKKVRTICKADVLRLSSYVLNDNNPIMLQ